MMNKKKISIVLAACLTLTVFGWAEAYAKPAQNKRQNTVKEKSVSESKLVEVTEDNLDDLIVTATMDWLNIIQPDIQFCVGDILEVNVDGSDEVQYMASVFNKTIPYGYVVVGFRNNEPVVMESNITKGQESLYTEIVEDIVDNSKMK